MFHAQKLTFSLTYPKPALFVPSPLSQKIAVPYIQLLRYENSGVVFNYHFLSHGVSNSLDPWTLTSKIIQNSGNSFCICCYLCPSHHCPLPISNLVPLQIHYSSSQREPVKRSPMISPLWLTPLYGLPSQEKLKATVALKTLRTQSAFSLFPRAPSCHPTPTHGSPQPFFPALWSLCW